MATPVYTWLMHRVCGSSSCGYHGSELFQSVVTRMKRVCHIDDFHAHPKGPSWVERRRTKKSSGIPSLRLPTLHSTPIVGGVSAQKGALPPDLFVFVVLERQDIPDSSKKFTSLFQQLHIFSAYFRRQGR